MTMAANHIENVLKRHGIHVPVTDERFSSHADLERGMRLRIECTDDEEHGKRITLGCGRFESTRPCPLTTFGAKSMADDLAEQHLIPKHGQERATLVHLLLRCSALFLDEELDHFTLSPLYLRENDYRVGSVGMTHSGPIGQRPRLEPDAHDKGAVFAYRRTARQKNVPKND
jgi:hypothetical protein